jgi:DNA-binding GntR family transcriptional regulator
VGTHLVRELAAHAHERIVEAVAECDVEVARMRMRDHLHALADFVTDQPAPPARRTPASSA